MYKLRKLFLGVLILSVLFGVIPVHPLHLIAGAEATSNLDMNVILISWDGVQRKHLYQLLRQGRLPNLQALISEGQIINLYISDHKTDSMAGHAEILTGYGPFITGIYCNKKNPIPIPDGYTIFERLNQFFGAESITTLMVTGYTTHLGNPVFMQNAVPDLDAYSFNDAEASIVGPIVIDYLNEYGNTNFFAFFHFSDTDWAGHRFGENSKQYTNAIITVDFWLGKILAKVKELKVAHKTLIYVTTDHGFNENSYLHYDAPFIFLATNDLSADILYQRQIASMILQRYGIDTSKITPSLDQPFNYFHHVLGNYYEDIYNNNKLKCKFIYKASLIHESIDFDWGLGPPYSGISRNKFSVRWRSIIDIPEDGFYKFFLQTDDGGKLYIDEKIVINDWASHQLSEVNSTVFLKSGYHFLRVEYYENYGLAIVRLGWQPPFGKKTYPIPPEYLYIELPVF